MNTMNKQELISALMDGQLEGDELRTALDAACADPQARSDWHAWHVIGDALRSQDLAVASSPERFLARLNESLRSEPVQRPVEVARIRAFDTSRPASNDALRWKWAAGVATLSAVAAISWSAMGGGGSGGIDRSMPQLASAPAASAPGVMLTGAASGAGAFTRDEQLDRLLAAHRQFGGATALQTPASFVRNASFETPAR